MNILILNYEYPPIGGGAGNITRHISQNLVLRGHKVVVVTTWYKGLLDHENENNKPEIFRLHSRRRYMHSSNPLDMLSWINATNKFLSSYLNTNKFDICLANFSIPGGTVALSLKKKFNLPFCVLSHGHDIPWYYKKQMFFYHCITYFHIKSICKSASLNFIQTELLKQNIDRFTGKKRSVKNIIISNGIELNKEVFNSQRQNEPFTILFVGRFVKQKDPLTLLIALKKLRNMDIHFRIFFVGDGPMRKKMEKFVHENKFENAIFTGWIPQEEVKEYYLKSHVILSPSIAEGMSIANLEALANGVYLIATPVSGNSEMLSLCKNGVLVDSGNSKEISNQLQKFYFEQYLPKNFQAQNCAKEFSDIFNWAEIAKQYETEFEKILTQK